MPTQNGLPRMLACLLFSLALLLTPSWAVRSLPPSAISLIPDPAIQGLLDQVTLARVQAYEQELTGERPAMAGGSLFTFSTRYSRLAFPMQQATQYAADHFQALGLAVSYFEYRLPSGETRRNVIAEQPGHTEPGCVYLVGAHLDDTSQVEYRNTLAPGADDNASGSTGVLIAAEILSRHRLRCTLRFVLFTGEEQGLNGSGAYAIYLKKQGQDIRGLLNLDMIGYNSDASPVIEMHTRSNNSSDLAIAQTYQEVISIYRLELAPHIRPDGEGWSDHATFWNSGYPAIMVIEDSSDFTPYYHTIDDRLETLNLAYLRAAIQAAVGTMAYLTGLEPDGMLSGTVSEIRGGDSLAGAALKAQLNTGPAWTATSQADGRFELNLPAGVFSVTALLPGYFPQVIWGVVINSGQNLQVNFALQGCTPPDPVDFSFEPAQPWVGQVVTFTAQAAGSPLAKLTWDFQDGSTAAGPAVQHIFRVSGGRRNYPVGLSASNGCYPAATTSHTVPVSAWQVSLPVLMMR